MASKISNIRGNATLGGFKGKPTLPVVVKLHTQLAALISRTSDSTVSGITRQRGNEERRALMLGEVGWNNTIYANGIIRRKCRRRNQLITARQRLLNFVSQSKVAFNLSTRGMAGERPLRRFLLEGAVQSSKISVWRTQNRRGCVRVL